MTLNKLKLIFFIFICLLLPFTSQAQKVLSLDECVQMGMESSKTLKISRSKVSSAEEKVAEVSNGMYPSLKFIGGYTRLSAIDPFAITMPSPTGPVSYTISPSLMNNYTAKLTLQQPIFTGFRLENSTELNRFNALATIEDLSKDKNQVVLDIKNAYWNFYKALELRKVVYENITQTQGHLNDVQSFYDRGIATNNDVLKVKVQMSNVQLLKLDAENNVKLAMMALNNVIGAPLTDDVKINSNIEPKNNDLPVLSNLIVYALKERHELKGIDLRLKAGESGVKMAQASWYPQLNFAANYNYMNPNPRIFPSHNQFDGTWDVGLSLTWDIWNWMTTSRQTAQAEATLEQTKYSMLQLKDAIVLDVSQSYFTLVKAKEKIAVAIESVSQAEENYRVVDSKFKSGIALNSDLLDAEAAVLQAKINYTNAIVDFEAAKARLDYSVSRKEN